MPNDAERARGLRREKENNRPLRHMSSYLARAALFAWSLTLTAPHNIDKAAEAAMDRAYTGMEENEVVKGKSSWSAAALRRSWWIGKKVAIAGAAITSAPVIIPPLFVLSTLSLAFSVPFGIYLAGYVCADKFMSVLLPVAPLTEEIDKESLESEDLIQRGLDADQGDEMVLGKEKWEKGKIIEDEKEEGGLLEFGNRNGVERQAVESDVEGKVEEVKTGDTIGEGDEMVKSVELRNDAATAEELRKSVFANVAKGDRGVQLGEVREDGNVIPESCGFPKSPYSVDVMAANRETSKKEYGPSNLSSEHLSIVEVGGDGKPNDAFVTEERREDNGEGERRLRVANGVVPKDKELSLKCRAEVPRLKSDYILSAVFVPSKDEEAEKLENVGSMEHERHGKPVSAAVVCVGVTGLHSHNERTHNEQLWDQIFSLRTIVGYKATLQPSLGEEIMALFLLIGVEPPISLKDATDLAEISNGLQFLKYVVGVN